MDINRATLLGRVGKDPEIRQTAGGRTVATFAVATGKEFTLQSGEKKKETQWHNCVAWGKLAELSEKYIKKGARLFVEGEIKQRSWEKEDKSKAYITEVVLSQIILLDAKKQITEYGEEDVTATVVGPDDKKISIEDVPF